MAARSPLIRGIGVLLLTGAILGATSESALASNDPLSSQQWGLARIKGEQAWQKSTGAGVVVAVIDTGVNLTHADLAGRSAGSYDCINGLCRPTSEVSDDNGHGTLVAGVIAASSNNCVGIASVAPHARILSIKVLNAQGSGTSDDVSEAIRFAADKGAKVINLSLASSFVEGPLNTLDIADSLNYAYNSKGVLIAAAAGNSGFASSYSSTPFVYVVGATGPNDEIPAYSSSLAGVDIHAPGGNPSSGCNPSTCILTTHRGGGYASVAGTSVAAPHVAGAGALLVALGYTNTQAIERIDATADPIAGGTRLNAAAATGAPARVVSAPTCGTSSAGVGGSGSAGGGTGVSGSSGGGGGSSGSSRGREGVSPTSGPNGPAGAEQPTAGPGSAAGTTSPPPGAEGPEATERTSKGFSLILNLLLAGLLTAAIAGAAIWAKLKARNSR